MVELYKTIPSQSAHNGWSEAIVSKDIVEVDDLLFASSARSLYHVSGPIQGLCRRSLLSAFAISQENVCVDVAVSVENLFNISATIT